MANIDLARRAEIGRERRAQTRSQILEAGAKLLSERHAAALTVDAVVEAAGVAKGTFYYHFQSMDDLVAAVGEKLAESFDEMLAPAMLAIRRSHRTPLFRLRKIPAQGDRRSLMGTPRGSKLAIAGCVRSRDSRPPQGGYCPGDCRRASEHRGRRLGCRYRYRDLASSRARHS